MQYRNLGSAGVKVSAIGLGSYLTIGMSIDEMIANQTVKAAYDGGVNFIDTANAYNKGEAEKSLKTILKQFRRDSLVLATKVFAPMNDGPNDRGLSRKHIFEQCDASLARLGVDYVDLYQCHRPVKDTPLVETVRAMVDLTRQGKVLYWGVSEWPAWLIEQAINIAEQLGGPAPVSNQPRYSLLYRKPESELWQFCKHRGIGNVVFSPLAHGVLSAKYEPGKDAPAGTRAADPKQNNVMKKMYWSDDILKRAKQLETIGKDIGATPVQVALAWVLRRSEVSSAIIGASKVSQVTENLKAAELELSDDVLAELDKLFPGPGETYPLS